ncbi:hypothetical protein KQI38_09290 [Tissierella carlieri]|uniref:hypothetical protein n=1 Tax=Tissierella carlieri TaxID=689904 RepID=UPI001C0FD36C|nr:hypothetical protein [Tissierella carlieri]MBU5312220.1 hypothetical protein [Tissierella carlieri]
MAVINGKSYDWADISVKLPGLDLEVQEISYDDELEKEAVYGKGNRPRGYGTGNYKSEGKMSLLKDDFDDLVAYCKRMGVSLYKLVIDKIVVSYANETQKTKTDELNTITFTKTSQKGAQGDKSLKVDMDFIIVNGINRDGLKPI